MSEIARRLPKNVFWIADPSGAEEIEQLRLAGFKVIRARNDIRAGIAAVTARLQSGRLKVNEQRCPNLMAEARLYRYTSASERQAMGENPVDEHNHALAALRYLVSRLDTRLMARQRRSELEEEQANDRPEQSRGPKFDVKNPALWTSL